MLSAGKQEIVNAQFKPILKKKGRRDSKCSNKSDSALIHFNYLFIFFCRFLLVIHDSFSRAHARIAYYAKTMEMGKKEKKQMPICH